MKIQTGQVQYEVDEAAHGEFWKLVNSGQWEKETFQILDRFVSEGDVVLDLGCWIGTISLYAAALGAEVYAIDPDPAVGEELLKNLSLNPELQHKINYQNLAITATNGALPLFARENYGESSSSILHRIRDQRGEKTVEGKTLMSFLDDEKVEKIDFIKMDIEGGEFVLLPHLHDAIKKLQFPVFYVSFHYQYLNEYQFAKYAKLNLFSRVVLKTLNTLGLDLFRQKNKDIILKCLQTFKDYSHIYTQAGQEISREQLLKNPWLIKDHNLVFSNLQWK